MHTVRSSDGVTLALHDLGGEGPPLLLVHATGFCAAVMGPLAAGLAGRYHCFAVDLRGHGLSTSPAPAAGWDWAGLAADTAAAAAAVASMKVASRVGTGPAAPAPVGIGHSSGGAALLAAEAAAPGTFASLWCYEPIVWPEPDEARPRAQRLAEGARRRRSEFPSRQAALDHFAAKPLFAAFDPRCLSAYVEGGFAEADDGSVRLRCDPAAEAAIYEAGVVGDRFGALSTVATEVTVAYGARTDALGVAAATRVSAALPAGRLTPLDGLGHFGPFENPAAVAAAIVADLADPAASAAPADPE